MIQRIAEENGPRSADDLLANTDLQRSYLTTLCHEADETFDPNLTKAQASKLIDALQHRTGRGATLRDATERKPG